MPFEAVCKYGLRHQAAFPLVTGYVCAFQAVQVHFSGPTATQFH